MSFWRSRCLLPHSGWLHPVRRSRMIMDSNFLSTVERRWSALCRAPGTAQARNVISKPSNSELLIEVETREAKATIAARETPPSLRIVVRRFKDERVLCEGSCPTDLELDRRLGLLCTDLSVSPFA